MSNFFISIDKDFELSDWEKIKNPSTLNATLRLTNAKGQGLVIMRSPLYSSNSEVNLIFTINIIIFPKN